MDAARQGPEQVVASQRPADPNGYLETANFWPAAEWHSYSGKNLYGQAAVDKFEQYTDGTSDAELSSMGFDVSGDGVGKLEKSYGKRGVYA